MNTDRNPPDDITGDNNNAETLEVPAPDWAAALTCVYACGLRHCPWECIAVFGGEPS